MNDKHLENIEALAEAEEEFRANLLEVLGQIKLVLMLIHEDFHKLGAE